MTRLKQNRTRKAGYRGSLNSQDFTTPLPSHNTLCRQNARTCYNILSAHIGKLNDSELEQRLTAALVALGRIGENHE